MDVGGIETHIKKIQNTWEENLNLGGFEVVLF